MSTPPRLTGTNQYLLPVPQGPQSASSAPYSPPGAHPAQQQAGYSGHSPYQQSVRPSGSQFKQADMVTLPPPPHIQQGMYNQPPYGDPYPQGQQAPPMGYSSQPHMPGQQHQQHQQHQQQQQAQQQQVAFNQPAPRQRTAIACRYCRRRKIRCYGFDTNPDGRCANCARFNQECVFTPVSSQTHAFVPAHTAFPGLRNQRYPPPQDPRDPRGPYPQPPPPPAVAGPPMYGAHGQPHTNVAPPPPPAPPSGDPQHNYPPPPSGPHQPYAAPTPYPGLPQPGPSQTPGYDSRPPLAHDRRASTNGPYASHVPPMSPSQQGYQTQPYSSGGYYSQQQDPAAAAQHRQSPPTGYGYDAARASTSPRGNGNVPQPGHIGHYGQPQSLPGSDSGSAGQRSDSQRPSAMSVASMLGDSSSPNSRSNTDSNMLNRLNSRQL